MRKNAFPTARCARATSWFARPHGSLSHALLTPRFGVALASLSLIAISLAPSTRAQSSPDKLFFTTLAGSGVRGARDDTGNAATFNFPIGVAVDAGANVFVADTGSHTIRKITAAGVVTTVAGLPGVSGIPDGSSNTILIGETVRFRGPRGVALDGSGNLYIADTYNHVIRKMTPNGVVTTLAGTPGTIGAIDSASGSVRFNAPSGVAVDGAGNVYVADTLNHTIRKITATGVVTTFAGQAGSSGSTDNTGSAARFNTPRGVAVDRSGNVYVADEGNHTIRKITPAQVVSTFAGVALSTGSADGTGNAARFNSPAGVAVDGRFNVYVADDGNNLIRRITASRVVTTFSGLAGVTGSTDGLGDEARFSSPSGIAVDGRGNVYVADSGNNKIRRSVFPPSVSLIAGPDGLVIAGERVRLLVSTASDFPVSLQWRKNGTAIAGATNSTLDIASSQPSDTGSYTVVATNLGGAVTSVPFQLAVASSPNGVLAPSILVQPLSQTVAAGSPVQLSVVATPVTGTTFQWRKDGVAIAGATNALFALNNASVADAGSYTVVVSNSGISVTSNAATIAVTAPVNPTITTQPVSQSVALGSPAQFSVEVTPLDGTTFQWRKDGASIVGATNAFLAINSATQADAGNYTVVVGNTGTPVTSAVATLAVSIPPSITAQPASQTVTTGAPAQFSVTVTPTTGTTFQWRKNNVAIVGATNALLTFNAAALSDSGSYTVVATNGAASVISNAATLTVNAPAGVPPSITNPPADVTVAAGAPFTLSVSAGGTQPLSFQWFKNGAALPGATTILFPILAAQASDEGSYSVVVNNSVGSAASTAAIVRVIVPPSIATQPASQIVTEGARVELSAVVSGTVPLRFQWRKDGGAISGATDSSFVLNSTRLADAGSYSVTIANAAGLANSAPASLIINAAGPSSRLSNLSVRASLATGQIVIVGIAVQGGSREVLVRAVGPGLGAFGLPGVMVDPRLELFRGQALLLANDDWPAALAPTFASSGAFALTLGSRDAAFRQPLDGAFSIQARGTGAGVVLVEAYDLGQGNTPRLVNVSARNRVGTGDDILIAGFSITGTGSKQLLIRAVGPGLAAFGVPGTLIDPRLEVFNSADVKITENDNWTESLAPMFGAVGAFGLPLNSRDAALITTLPPGTYTVQVRGTDGGTGEALVEIYEVP